MTDAEKVMLIDAGNSRVKWAVWDGGLGAQQAVSWDELSDGGATIQIPDGRFRVVAANVAGERFDRLIAKPLREKAANIVRIESEASACGVTNGYRNPGQMGCDRWAAMIGAWHRTQRTTLVVSAGTAATIDMLDDSGTHLGGLIVPGYQMMIDSLLGKTSGIARVAEKDSPDVAGMAARSTGEAIRAGALYALLSLVDNSRSHLAETGGAAPKVILTGGHAGLLQERLDDVESVPDLVLRGLTILAGKQP